MRFLLDENMPRSLLRALMEAGHDAVFAADDATLAAQSDEVLIDRCNAESRFLVTRDIGISEISSRLRTGLVLVRLRKTAIAPEITLTVAAAISGITEDALQGTILIVMPGRTRLAALPER